MRSWIEDRLEDLRDQWKYVGAAVALVAAAVAASVAGVSAYNASCELPPSVTMEARYAPQMPLHRIPSGVEPVYLASDALYLTSNFRLYLCSTATTYPEPLLAQEQNYLDYQARTPHHKQSPGGGENTRQYLKVWRWEDKYYVVCVGAKTFRGMNRMDDSLHGIRGWTPLPIERFVVCPEASGEPSFQAAFGDKPKSASETADERAKADAKAKERADWDKVMGEIRASQAEIDRLLEQARKRNEAWKAESEAKRAREPAEADLEPMGPPEPRDIEKAKAEAVGSGGVGVGVCVMLVMMALFYTK